MAALKVSQNFRDRGWSGRSILPPTRSRGVPYNLLRIGQRSHEIATSTSSWERSPFTPSSTEIAWGFVSDGRQGKRGRENVVERPLSTIAKMHPRAFNAASNQERAGKSGKNGCNRASKLRTVRKNMRYARRNERLRVIPPVVPGVP